MLDSQLRGPTATATIAIAHSSSFVLMWLRFTPCLGHLRPRLAESIVGIGPVSATFEPWVSIWPS